MHIATLAAAAVVLATAEACWWKPHAGITWNYQLATPLKQPFANISTFDIDVFDNPATTMAAVHKKGGKVICYFSAGSYEVWRPDAKKFPESVLGKPLSGWKGERWLDVRSPIVREIMVERMHLAKNKSCDAIDPDNTDAYNNGDVGFPLTQEDALDYVKFLAAEGHKLGMAVGLKNTLDIIPDVVHDVDFAVNEQCVQYDECDESRPFIDNGKPVLEVEYKKGPISSWPIASVCDDPQRAGFSTLIKYLNLTEPFVACPLKA